MPNHITNILIIEDAAGVPLADIRAVFVNDKGLVDFNVVRPAPACLEGFEPHSGILARATAALGLLPDPKSIDGADLRSLTKRLELSNALRDVTTKIRDEDIPHLVRAISNYHECGYMYWYDWNREHWGTKWNCYGQPDEGQSADATQFEFQTAWAHPEDVVALISKRLPDVVFRVQYADEDTGSNCGTYLVKSGNRFNEDIAPRHSEQSPLERRKWTEFAFRLTHGDVDPASCGYGPDWEYSDDVYEAYERRQEGASTS